MPSVKESFGVYFGYPECCIREFHAVLFEKDPLRKAELRQGRALNHAVSNRSGFVPCDYHTGLVASGMIRLEELIKGRICKKPFI